MTTYHMLCLSCLALAITGCATPPEPAPYGASVSLAMAQQVLNPTAGSRPQPVNGIDGQAAKSAYDAYQKTFRSPEPQPNTFTIGVGGAR